MTHEPTGAALPPGHVPTVRVATPDPRDAKRHIRIRSGWPRDYMTACLVTLPKDCCETDSAAVDEIECPRCRESREFAQAVEQANDPKMPPQAEPETTRTEPRAAPARPRPERPTRPKKKAAGTGTENGNQSSPQGLLF